MGTRFRNERLDGRNENGSVAPHVAVALDVMNPMLAGAPDQSNQLSV
jgi:hypothetical protein